MSSSPSGMEVDQHFNPDPFHVSVIGAFSQHISEGPRASECGDLSLFGFRPASQQRSGQLWECVLSLSLTRVWLALRPASQARDKYSLITQSPALRRREPCVCFIVHGQRLEILHFLGASVCEWGLMKQWCTRRSGRGTHIVPFCPVSPDTFHLNQNVFSGAGRR